MDLNQIIRVINSSEFINKLANREIPFSRSSAELKSYISAASGVPFEDVEKNWDVIWRHIKYVFEERPRISKSPPKQQAVSPTNMTKDESDSTIRINTLANTIYFVLYERHGTRAPEIIYRLLEPMMTKALVEGGESAVKARLLFLPAAPDTLEGILEVYKEILLTGKEFLCSDEDLHLSLCRVSSELPSGDARIKGYTSDDCARKVSQIFREVCINGLH